MLAETRTGNGRPLLLVHGLGGNRASWRPVLAPLAAAREVIAIDLPGHGASPAEPDSGTFEGLVRSVEAHLEAGGLRGVDAAGFSLGGRVVLELARRGSVGAVVSLDPGGFWRGWERTFLRVSLLASLGMVRMMGPAALLAARAAPSRSLLFAQLSAHPWRLDPTLVADELKSFATTPTFTALTRDLAGGPEQEGPAAPGSGPIVIVWGRNDRLCLPQQADRARAAFPGSRLHRLDACGHYAIWDQSEACIELILNATDGTGGTNSP